MHKFGVQRPVVQERGSNESAICKRSVIWSYYLPGILETVNETPMEVIDQGFQGRK